MITNEELFELENLVYQDSIEKGRESLLDFTKATMPAFEPAPFHRTYYQILDLFAKGKIKKLMVTMPPQHGKSEGSTRRIPAYLFGKDPDRRIAVTSYNSTFARKFNRDVQRIIDTKEYGDIFPETRLNSSNVVTIANSYLRNSEEFEIVNHIGSLKAVGRGGALTGNTIDVAIMDDLYKDYAEGNSPTIRESVWDWYTSVVSTRLHNDSQQLIVFTRWHQDDLIGKIQKKENVVTIERFEDLIGLNEDTWVKINFEALKTGEPTQLDERLKGDALWESRHSKHKLEQARSMDAEKFNCLYQGNPMSQKGLLYKPFKTYADLPDLRIRKCYVDTADTGDDFLCAIVYGEPLNSSDKYLYVLDVLYTQDAMEETEPATINLINRNEVNETTVESNNGGRGFARVLDDGVSSAVDWFHQSKNKEARIFSRSATVNSTILFPSNWHIQFPEFYEHVTHYKKIFKSNAHDDAPDTMTGIIERMDTSEPMIGW